MQIISHRGYWRSPEEKNSKIAFERSFSRGFGTETDLRDCLDKLVISHDPPTRGALPADSFFQILASYDTTLPIALNIKSDGLQKPIKDCIDRFGLSNAFVFDMAVPDAIQWLKSGVSTFTRQSDVERTPTLYRESAGIWLDAFFEDWWDYDDIEKHLDAGKKVCIVSPELHQREHRGAWDRLVASGNLNSSQIMLCTDLPEEAQMVFQHEH